MTTDPSLPEIVITEIQISKKKAMIAAVFFWVIFLFLIFYFDEFSSMVMEMKSRRYSNRSNNHVFKMVMVYLVPIATLFSALYYSKLVKEHKNEAPPEIMKISNKGIWHVTFGQFQWEDLWYFSTLTEKHSGNEYLILKFFKDDKEIRIETSGLSVDSDELRHYISRCNTNENLKDAGHLVDDTRYDRYGNVTN